MGKRLDRAKAMTMNLYLVGLALSLTTLISVASFPQNEIIEIERPYVVQKLSGTVRLGRSSEGIKGVLVESCSSDWKIVKALTHTDENGHFTLPNARSKEMHFLRLSLYGAHTMLIRVKISKSGDKELSLVLDFKT